MGVALVMLRRDLRRRAGSHLLLALVVALTVALPTAAVTGARRTASVIDRMGDELASWDLTVQFEELSDKASAREVVVGLPAVAEAGEVASLFAAPRGLGLQPGIETFGSVIVDPEVGDEIARLRMEEGRLPVGADEVLLSPTLAERAGVDVGDVLTVETYTMERLFSIFGGATDVSTDGPEVPLEVVGLGRTQSEVVGTNSLRNGMMVMAGPFLEVWGERVAHFRGVVLVRLEPGASLSDFRAQLDDATGGADVVITTAAAEDERARDGVRGQAAGLWVVAAVVATAGLVTSLQAIARHLAANRPDQQQLAGVGAGRRDLWIVRAVGAGVPAAAGLVLAIPVSVLVGGFLPTGPAGRIEPDPGPLVDVLGTSVSVLAFAAVVGAGLAVVSRERAPVRRSTHRASWRPILGRPLPGRLGLRYAFDSRTSGGRVPVRQSIVAATTGIVGAVAALVLVATIGRLVDVPRAWGWDFDVEVVIGDFLDDDEARAAAGVLARLPQVASAGLLRIGNLDAGEGDLAIFGWEPVSGDRSLVTVEGRLPMSLDEVAVAPDTVARLGATIGERVELTGPGGTATFDVVGTVLVPTSEQDTPTEGVVTTLEGLDRLAAAAAGSEPFGYPTLLVAAADGTSVAQLRAALTEAGHPSQAPPSPGSVANLTGVDEMPVAVGAFVAVLGLVTVGHAAAVSARRRRRDLGVLRCLGVSRASVRSIVRNQPLAHVAVGAALGIPLGIALGRIAWQMFVDRLGFGPAAVLPTMDVATLVLVCVMATVLVAEVPARLASRARPAVVLRAE